MTTRMATKIMSFRSIKKSGVYFGCYGNPMPKVCNCCDTNEKNFENYKMYLKNENIANKYNYRKEKYEHDGRFSIFVPLTE